jgi:hypothetical protein
VHWNCYREGVEDFFQTKERIIGVQSNETRKEQQTGQGSQQRQDEKNRENFNRDNPNEAQGQNKQNQGCDSDVGKVEGQHCGTEGQKKNQPQQKGQSQPQRQNK